jgi:hypothetical protein
VERTDFVRTHNPIGPRRDQLDPPALQVTRWRDGVTLEFPLGTEPFAIGAMLRGRHAIERV